MRGAGREVRPHAAPDRLGVTREYHRIDEPVTATVGQVSLGKALTEPAVAIIRQHHVTRQSLASERPRLREIGSSVTFCSTASHFEDPRIAAAWVVLRRHVVWDGATRLGIAQRQRFLVAMAAYTFDHRNVTDAETENELAAVERVQ